MQEIHFGSIFQGLIPTSLEMLSASLVAFSNLPMMAYSWSVSSLIDFIFFLMASILISCFEEVVWNKLYYTLFSIEKPYVIPSLHLDIMFDVYRQ